MLTVIINLDGMQSLTTVLCMVFNKVSFLTLSLRYYFVFLFIQISQLVSDVQQLQVMQSRLKESGANEVECKLCKSFVI